MALEHALPGEVVDIRPLGTRLRESRTHALFKSEFLELMMLVLPKGQRLPPHRVPGPITIQCIEGALRVTNGDEELRLQAGELVWLEGNALHEVEALDDASALVTVVLRDSPTI